MHKIFTCNHSDCDLTFIEENLFATHLKNHEIKLILEPDTKTINSADQTPTPTSFLRNCEEVGLFQDLQNVNPFEETFKKALEVPTNLQTIRGDILNNHDDYLNTPHVISSSDIDNGGTSRESASSNLNPTESSKAREIHKQKLKNAILSKSKDKKTSSNKTEIPMVNSIVRLENVVEKKVDKTPEQISKIEKIREMNRAAQTRSRIKKKRQLDRFMSELTNLRRENTILKAEVTQLRSENFQLKQTTVNLMKSLQKDNKNVNSTNLYTINAAKSSSQTVIYNLIPVSCELELKKRT